MRKAEVEAVEGLLHEPAEDATELARRIIKKLDEHRASSDQKYFTILRQTGNLVQAIGQYPTAAAAGREIERGKLPAIDGTRFVVAPWTGQRSEELALDRADDSNVGEEARKSWKVLRKPARSRTW